MLKFRRHIDRAIFSEERRQIITFALQGPAEAEMVRTAATSRVDSPPIPPACSGVTSDKGFANQSRWGARFLLAHSPPSPPVQIFRA